MDNNLNIALVTPSYSPPRDIVPTGLGKFITEILAPLCARLFVITGQLPKIHNQDIRLIKLRHKLGKGESLGARIHKLIAPQFQITWNLIKLSKNYNLIIFFCTAELFLLPALVGKLFLRKKVVIIHTGNLSISFGNLYQNKLGGLGRVVSFALRVAEKIAFSTADQIIVQSKDIIRLMGLESYQDKISIAHYYFVDNANFEITKALKNRSNLVGYIGKFAEFKGAVNFARAIPLILSEQNDISFLMIGGTGTEFSRVEEELRQSGSLPKVTLLGQTPHEEIAKYLNELKLLVLPSYSEGVPKVVLEAMACGTPVLATAVGGIPELIQNGVSGFLLKDNSPQSIAQGVILALEHPHLADISRNAQKQMEENYTADSIARRWQALLSSRR